MAFKGTLKEFKVPDILQLISLQKKTGILTFTSTDGIITLIFDQGAIVGVDSFPRKIETRVGNVLVKQDHISEEMLQRALAIQKRTNQKIGEILVGMGMVSETTISDSLKIQAQAVVLSLFQWKKGEYNFKIMDYLDRTMKMIEPIQTDNLLMEGVQMLDEWPMIMKLIPDNTIVFEPIPIESKNIEIVDEYDEESDRKGGQKIHLSETEAHLLKYIDGKNSVVDLVEMGVFTEYKVYKCLFNLINKNVIKIKARIDNDQAVADERIAAEMKMNTSAYIDKVFILLLVLFVLLFLFTFFKPLSPFSSKNVIIKSELYTEVFPDKPDSRPVAKKTDNK